MDKSAAVEATEFIKKYFANYGLNENDKRKRFPAVFSVYLSGLDHEAHVNGLSGYKNYFTETVDDQIKSIVATLKGFDEFDNKIFIIVSDHGETQMPDDLTYEKTVENIDMEGNPLPDPSIIQLPIDISCSLKTNMDNEDVLSSELNNNNLHIWELANLFTLFSSPVPVVTLKLLVPEEIARYEDINATSDIDQANIIAALNGPMAHIYIKGNSWQSEPDPQTLNLVLNRMYSYLKSGLTTSGKTKTLLNNHFPKLLNSIADIMVRKNMTANSGSNYVYDMVTSITEDASGNLNVAYAPLSNSIGDVDAPNRINNMNSFNRSGDIVLLMRDAATGSASDRYSTAYACKSWHGSLNSADSYVPFVISYPGGSKSELSIIIDGVCADNGCNSNGKLPEVIKSIIRKQY